MNINQPFAFQFVNNYRTGFIHPTVSLTFDTLQQQQQQQQEQANMCEPSPQSKIKPWTPTPSLCHEHQLPFTIKSY